jgi:hypothetical protein
MKMLVAMSDFRILVFRDVSLDSEFEILKQANQRSNNAVPTSNFAADAFQI